MYAVQPHPSSISYFSFERYDDHNLTIDRPVDAFSSDALLLEGCNCATTYGPVPTSSLFIRQPNQGGAGYCGGPVCQISSTSVPGNGLEYYYCNCAAFASQYSLSTPFQNNPCSGYEYTATVTGTCTTS